MKSLISKYSSEIKYVLRVFFFDPCIHQWNIKSWIEILQRNKLENDEQPQQINSNPLQGILSVSWLGFFFKTSHPLWQSVSSFIRWTCKICHRGKCCSSFGGVLFSIPLTVSWEFYSIYSSSYKSNLSNLIIEMTFYDADYPCNCSLVPVILCSLMH